MKSFKIILPEQIDWDKIPKLDIVSMYPSPRQIVKMHLNAKYGSLEDRHTTKAYKMYKLKQAAQVTKVAQTFTRKQVLECIKKYGDEESIYNDN